MVDNFEGERPARRLHSKEQTPTPKRRRIVICKEKDDGRQHIANGFLWASARKELERTTIKVAEENGSLR
jgi:hypothetical protein